MAPHIYMLTLNRDTESFPKGARYIGKSASIRKKYFTGGTIPLRIIKKYGRGVFDKEIIISGAFSADELSMLEVEYIRMFDTVGNGLNLTRGGEGVACTLPVFQYTLSGHFITEWENGVEAANALGIDSTFIWKVCRSYNKPSGHKKYGGYQWRLFKEYKIEDITHYRCKAVSKYSLDGFFIRAYENPYVAAEDIGSTYAAIIQAANPNARVLAHGGYLWRYTSDQKINKPVYIGKVPTYQYALDGKFLREFPSSSVAAREYGRRDINFKLKSYLGFQWRRYKVENCGAYVQNKGANMRKSIVCTTLGGEPTRTFRSVIEAANFVETYKDKITAACTGRIESVGGFKFKYA